MISTQDFLRYFGSPLVCSLADIKGVNTFTFSLHHTSDVLWELNKKEPYGLFFTPNGNYGEIQGTNQRISRSMVQPGPGPIYNALSIDIDKKTSTYKDDESLLVHIHEVIDKHGIPPTLIVRSFGGFHLYRVVHTEHRQAVQDIIGTKFFDISMYLAQLFDGGDSNAPASKSINGLIRVPGSNHRKTGEPHEVKVIEHNPKILLTLGNIETFFKNVDETKHVVVSQKNAPVVFGAERANIINNFPFTDVFTALEKYPRYINGHSETFRLDGTDICIVLENGDIQRTDGYRLWREKNAVNNFTSEYHDINERPRGPVFAFIYHYFGKDVNKVKIFLKNEFGLDLGAASLREEEKQLKVFVGEDYSIEVTTKRVMIHRQTKGKGGALNATAKDLFAVPIKIIGKAKVKAGANGVESDELQLVYLFEVNGQNKVIFRFSGKRKFNDRYSTAGLFFFGEDNDLGYFYDALDKSDLPEIDIITHNGFFDNCIILGNKLIMGDPEGKYIATSSEFDVCDKAQQVSVKEFLDATKTLYKEHLIVPAFLQTLAMAGMNLRKKNQVYPGILLTGRSGCGKSSIRDICVGAVGYEQSSRIIALPQISPQPLKVFATDNSILSCNELTLQVNEKVEEALRNIINKDKGARGIGVDNAYYNFRSPLFVIGERTFKDESLNNRIVVLVMSEDDWLPGMKEDVAKMRQFSCYDEVYGTYLNLKEDINALHELYSFKLAKEGVNSRAAEVRSYLFVVNKIFNIGYTREQLSEMMKRHLKNMGFDENNDTTDEGELQMWLSKQIFTRKAQCVIEDFDDKKIMRIMFVDETLYEKARGRFTMLVNNMNSKSGDDIQRIKINKDGVTITIHTMRETKKPIDYVLNKIEQFILIGNRNNVSRIDVSVGSSYQEGTF